MGSQNGSADSRRSAVQGVLAKPTMGVPNRQAVPAWAANQPSRAGAPPVYRPNNQLAQAKSGSGPANSKAMAAPRVYIPARAKVSAPPVFRPNASAPLQRSQGNAPPVYRPQTGGRPLSTGATAHLAPRAGAISGGAGAKDARPGRVTGRAPLGPVPLGRGIQPVQRKSLLVIQRMGQNIDLVAQEDRFFETRTGKTRLRTDPDNDAYLEHHFNEATRVSKTDSDLAEKLIYLLSYYKFEIPYNKQNKIDAFDSNVQPIQGGSQKVRNLGTMMHAKAATCWEKAALFHFSLAEIGIASMLEGGFKKTSGTGHAWVVLDVVGSSIVIDPTSKRIAKHSDYEEAYDITVVAKRVASPKVAVTGTKLKEALSEVHRYLGGSLETITIKRIDLKIEQQKKKEQREAESREFDKLLKGFNESLKF